MVHDLTHVNSSTVELIYLVPFLMNLDIGWEVELPIAVGGRVRRVKYFYSFLV
jgi:hypothetical protein